MKYLSILLILIGITILLSEVAESLSGYNYYIEYELQNEGTATYSAPLNITINAAGLIDEGYIQEDAEDIAVTYLGQPEYITAMNLESGSATWRMERIELAPGAQAKKVMWVGNPTMTRNQPWISDDQDVCTLPTNPGSFNFAAYAGGSGTQPFAIRLNIEPSTYPGTKQLIIGLGDSWKLELYPQSNITEEPWYKWSVMSGSGNVLHSATITANVGQMANVWAWYNGTDIVISDGSYHKTSTLPVGLVSNTGTPVFGAVDAVIDDLRITTPGSIIAPAGGLPDGYGDIYPVGPDSDYLLSASCGKGPYAADYVTSADPDAADYLVDYINVQSEDGVGWIHTRNAAVSGLYPVIEILDDIPVGATITGVSISVSGWVDFESCEWRRDLSKCSESQTGVSIDRLGLEEILPSGYSAYYWDSVKYDIFGQPGNRKYFSCTSGTRTLTPMNEPWTVTTLNDNLQIHCDINDTRCCENYSDIHITEFRVNVGVE